MDICDSRVAFSTEKSWYLCDNSDKNPKMKIDRSIQIALASYVTVLRPSKLCRWNDWFYAVLGFSRLTDRRMDICTCANQTSSSCLEGVPFVTHLVIPNIITTQHHTQHHHITSPHNITHNITTIILIHHPFNLLLERLLSFSACFFEGFPNLIFHQKMLKIYIISSSNVQRVF